ncbi:hypothetical protein BOTCAL_0327g00130 [Botryotinia calthae]|uniref:Uncharacterized protein n=1 Tax=Botryotinia calthae TaxID=38488 RepID=A0A4Y8CVZ9_9HELO|nr:hypothetical protein BOTCAL_0327g00130 [Botryotinia calthae]
MVPSTFSDMLQSPYHPDHIFGDEDTWYDAPADLPQQEIEEYFDALEDQNVLIGWATNRFVSDPERGYWPVLPTATLNNEIDAFITDENLCNDTPEYIQLEVICAKLSNLHKHHERDIQTEDHMIRMALKKLRAVRETLYEPDNIYTGSDYKRKRDLVVERIDECSRTKACLENEYVDTVSKLAKKAEEISQKWKKESKEQETELAEKQMRENNSGTQHLLRNALKEKALRERELNDLQEVIELLETEIDQYEEGYNNLRRVRDGVLGQHNQRIDLAIEQRDNARLQVRNLKNHLKTHRDAIILERRRRGVAVKSCRNLMRNLDMETRESKLVERDLVEARTRVDDLNHGIDLLKKRLADQRTWSDELEMHGMQGEVFNRMGGTWEPSVYKRRLEEYEDCEREERTAKRARRN